MDVVPANIRLASRFDKKFQLEELSAKSSQTRKNGKLSNAPTCTFILDVACAYSHSSEDHCLLRRKMQFRLTTATPRPVGSVSRCKCVYHMCGPFPMPMCACRAMRPGRRGFSLALDSTSVRRRPRSGASSSNIDIERRTRYFLPVIFCIIDKHSIVSFGLPLSAIQTLAFHHLFRRQLVVIQRRR